MGSVNSTARRVFRSPPRRRASDRLASITRPRRPERVSTEEPRSEPPSLVRPRRHYGHQHHSGTTAAASPLSQPLISDNSISEEPPVLLTQEPTHVEDDNFYERDNASPDQVADQKKMSNMFGRLVRSTKKALKKSRRRSKKNASTSAPPIDGVGQSVDPVSQDNYPDHQPSPPSPTCEPIQQEEENEDEDEEQDENENEDEQLQEQQQEQQQNEQEQKQQQEQQEQKQKFPIREAQNNNRTYYHVMWSTDRPSSVATRQVPVAATIVAAPAANNPRNLSVRFGPDQVRLFNREDEEPVDHDNDNDHDSDNEDEDEDDDYDAYLARDIWSDVDDRADTHRTKILIDYKPTSAQCDGITHLQAPLSFCRHVGGSGFGLYNDHGDCWGTTLSDYTLHRTQAGPPMSPSPQSPFPLCGRGIRRSQSVSPPPPLQGFRAHLRQTPQRTRLALKRAMDFLMDPETPLEEWCLAMSTLLCNSRMSPQARFRRFEDFYNGEPSIARYRSNSLVKQEMVLDKAEKHWRDEREAEMQALVTAAATHQAESIKEKQRRETAVQAKKVHVILSSGYKDPSPIAAALELSDDDE